MRPRSREAARPAAASRSWSFVAPIEINGLSSVTNAAVSTVTIRFREKLSEFEKVDIRLMLNDQRFTHALQVSWVKRR